MKLLNSHKIFNFFQLYNNSSFKNICETRKSKNSNLNHVKTANFDLKLAILKNQKIKRVNTFLFKPNTVNKSFLIESNFVI